MIASASLLLAAPVMDGNSSAMQGKGMGQGGKGMMMSQGKCGQGMQKMQGKRMMMVKQAKVRKMRHMQKMHSPFLIKKGLPHLSKMIMRSWDDAAFGLTNEQKSKLEAIRKETMGPIMKLKKEIVPLTKTIISGAYGGKSSDALKSDVKKLAELEAEATIIQLQCLEKTKEVLTKDQLVYLLQKSMRHKKMHRMMR